MENGTDETTGKTVISEFEKVANTFTPYTNPHRSIAKAKVTGVEDKVCNGKEKKPAPAVTLNNTLLKRELTTPFHTKIIRRSALLPL